MDTQLSLKQFWMQYGYKPYEFIDGHVVRRPRLSMIESVVVLRVSALIEQFAAENDLGEVVSSLGFRLGGNILTPRAAFIAKPLWDSVRHPYNPFAFAPTLVVELASVEQTGSEGRYLRAGTAQVWEIHIQSHKVTVHMAQTVAQDYNLGDILSGGRVLPGLLLPITSLFPKSRHV
jgi:Uma2 family endonuclease